MKDITNNNGYEVYIEKNTLSSLENHKHLTIDGKEMNLYGKKVARLTLIKN